MFTGLVEDVGQVVAAEHHGDSVLLSIAPKSFAVAELALGDSVAIDGTCLTVTARGEGRFQALAGPETLSRTTLGLLGAGASVNLERALRAGDRLGGHMVQGHVDGVGVITARTANGPAVNIAVEAPAALGRYMIEKGSICVDGISLTINAIIDPSDTARGCTFEVSLIPHTQDATTFAGKPVGAKVNLEVDLIAKYVERLVEPHKQGRIG